MRRRDGTTPGPRGIHLAQSGEPEQADEAHSDEDGAPSVFGDGEAGTDSPDGGAGFESEADEGVGESAMVFGEMAGQHF